MILNRLFAILLLSIMAMSLYSQGSCGYFDDRNFFYTFTKGSISKAEILKIDTFFPSLNYVAYLDKYNNFKLAYNHQVYKIFPLAPMRVEVSNYLMAYNLGSQLGVFNGKQSKKVETFTNGDFKLGDSLIGYIDNFDRLKVYVYDTIFELNNWADDDMYKVSPNILAFKTQDSKLNAFYNKTLYKVDEYLTSDYFLSKDIIVFHDNISNFKLFDRGMIYTIEPYRVENFDLAHSTLLYLNNYNEWKMFYDGVATRLLSTQPKFKFSKRNMVAFADNSNKFSVIYKGKVILLENYLPEKMDAWDDILVYEDMNRKLMGFVNGEKIQISEGIVKDWNMQNKCIVYYDLTPNVKTVWNQGKLYKYSLENDPTR